MGAKQHRLSLHVVKVNTMHAVKTTFHTVISRDEICHEDTLNQRITHTTAHSRNSFGAKRLVISPIWHHKHPVIQLRFN